MPYYQIEANYFLQLIINSCLYFLLVSGWNYMGVRSRYVRRHTYRTLVAIIQQLSLCRHRFRGIIRGYHPWIRKLRSTRDSKHEGGERPIRPVSVIPLLPSFYFQVKTTKPESKSRSRINKKILLA